MSRLINPFEHLIEQNVMSVSALWSTARKLRYTEHLYFHATLHLQYQNVAKEMKSNYDFRMAMHAKQHNFLFQSTMTSADLHQDCVVYKKNLLPLSIVHVQLLNCDTFRIQNQCCNALMNHMCLIKLFIIYGLDSRFS